ncbi:class I SAM-dependent methyltransferase [Parvularcula dongshanensis]|uniref:SAM-dependent methyltransferase n=1 Tax=Parvularcula dongshanensis TaxID=1173995 RepID=A0A840I2B1_9PROT|nr:class I SAM-dependent methyltransferase [Parvularcula dongshanensis]MBB4658421.1 SAM-dependent methyltransferase [Parvularcula dongshanensis]
MSCEDKVSGHLRHFETLYAASDDPWRYRSLWTEEHKRRVVGTLLGSHRLACGLEIGCGPGVSTLALAPRFLRLLALDGSSRAVEIAKRRLRAERHVEVRRAILPCALPRAAFDAAIASEVLYYLPDRARRDLIGSLAAALKPGGRFVTVNHLKRFDDAEVNVDRLTAELAAAFGPSRRRVNGASWRADLYRRR